MVGCSSTIKGIPSGSYFLTNSEGEILSHSPESAWSVGVMGTVTYRYATFRIVKIDGNTYFESRGEDSFRLKVTYCHETEILSVVMPVQEDGSEYPRLRPTEDSTMKVFNFKLKEI